MKPYFVLAGMLLAVLGNAQADTYRWVDKSGKVHYGDEPPADEAAQVEQKKFGVAPERRMPTCLMQHVSHDRIFRSLFTLRKTVAIPASKRVIF